MTPRANISGTTLRTAFVLLLVAGVTVLFLAVTWPFLKPLVLGAMLAGLSRPLYRWVMRWTGRRRSLSAALTLLFLFLIVAGPISAFAGLVVQQAVSIGNEAIPWLRQHFGAASGFDAHDWLVARFPALTNYVPRHEEILEGVGNIAKSASGVLVAGLSRMTIGTAAFLLNLFVMVYAMFYFLRDGRQIVERIFYYTPLTHEDEARVLERLTSVTRATVKGTMVIGVLQGALAGLGFWVAGIDGAAFWGTLMTILSIVPGVGAALIWIPAVIYLFATGQTLTAIMLTAWCAAIVGTVDNILRPRLVGKDAKMPDLLILVGTLGGLFLFGPIGFIVGPIVCGLFLTVWDIYGTTFRDILPPVRSLRTGEVKEAEATLEEKTTLPQSQKEPL
ncbi:AI-2E family transporter [soil metagenome]|nr:AI-2E family transporter [Chthoniobacterales bacterium]